MLFEDPSLQLLLMIVCALESLQRSLSTEGSYCFSTTFERSVKNGITVQRFQISFFFSGNLLDQIYDKQNRLLNSELPRHPFYIGLDPCGHKFQRGGKNFVYSESFSGQQNMFCNSLDGVISESGCFY